MKNFLKRLMGFSIGPIIGALISIIQIPILTRLMLVDQYGVSGNFRTLMLNIPNFLYLGLDQAFSREYHQLKDKKHLFQQALLIPLLLGLIFAGSLFFFNEPIAEWLFASRQYGYVVMWSGVLLIAMIVERFVLLLIRMEERAREYSFFTILLKLSIFICSIGLIFLGLRDFKVIVYGMIIGQLLVDLFLFLRYRQFFDLSGFNFDQTLMKQLFAFGLPLMIAMSLNATLNMIDNIMLNSISTKVELGIYTAGINIVNLIGIFKTAFTTFWTPTAYRWYDEDKSIKHFKFISDALLFILTGIYFGILIFRPVIMVILGPSYEPAKYILGLLCFPHIMYTLSETTTLGIVFSRKTYFNIFVSLLALIPSVGLNLWLTPHLGALGAASASCGAYIIFYLARTYFSRQTGFYFSQRKHLLSVLLMVLAAYLNTLDTSYRLIGITLLGLMALWVQYPTIQDALSIKRSPELWNFN